MECVVLYGTGGCLSLSIPSGSVKSSLKGGRKCYNNGFTHINGVYYASCSEKALLDIISNGEVRTIALPELCPVLKSIPNSILVAGSDSGKIYFWNSINGTLITTFRAHSKQITCIDFDQSFNTILTGSIDSSMKLFCQPLVTCEEIAIFYGHLGPIISCINLISHKYKFNIASISEDSTLKLWKLQKSIDKQAGVCIHTIDLQAKPICMLKGLNGCLYVPLANSKLFKVDLQGIFAPEKCICEKSPDSFQRYYNFTKCIRICESCEGYHLISLGVDGTRIWDSDSITCLVHVNLGNDCDCILTSVNMNALVTKTSFKVTESNDCSITLLQGDKESVRSAASKAQSALVKLLPNNPMLPNLDLGLHLQLYKESEQLYKLLELQVIETAKQMESLDEFNKLYDKINYKN